MPVRRACAGLFPAERVLVLLDAELAECDVRSFLLPDVLRDRGLVHADGRDVAALRPELPVPELVLEVACLAGHEERALPLQAAHEARHADPGRDARWHVHVVRHQVPLHHLGALPLAWLTGDHPEALGASAADGLPSMLWARHDVAPAHPLGVRKAVGLLCHGVPLPPAAGDLNNHHPGGGGVSLHSIVAIHPPSEWLSVPRGTG